MLQAFFYGFALSLSLILPLGVQNMYVFNQGALHSNVRQALPSALTAALCDSLLIVLAVMGVSLTVLSIPWFKNLILIIGGCFLLFMGISTWNAKVTSSTQRETPSSVKRQIFYAITVSLLNPHALLDTVAVIGTSSANFIGTEKWVYTVACLLVSYIWFFSLLLAGKYLRKSDAHGSWLKRINKASALIMWSVAGILFCRLSY